MILLIDNYDSFVFNLARYVRELGHPTEVVRNDQITAAQVLALRPRAIILSPGPCTPAEAGVCLPLIQRAIIPRAQGQIPLLGVCLGHQAIAAALGGRVVRAAEPVHGRSSWVVHQQTPLFHGIQSPFQAARYHSLIVEEASLPPPLSITARTTDGVPMAIEAPELQLYGVQFHPESILSEFGHRLLSNFLQIAGLPRLPLPVNDLQPTVTAGDIPLPAVPSRPVPWPASLTEDSQQPPQWDWSQVE